VQNLFPKIGNTLKLSQVIQKKIEELIRTKKLIPGQKLPTEKELCESFGVSRTALREAIQMLAAKGLISVKKGSGIFVNDYSSATARDFISLYLEVNFDKESILHVIKVRQILEPEITKLAALNRDDQDLSKIEKNLKSFQNCDKCDVKSLGTLDREFHLLIAESSKNPLIPLIIDPIFRLMPKIRTLVYAKIDHAESAALDFHTKIYNSIVKQDSEKAFQLMVEHLKIAEAHSLEVLKAI